MDIDMAKTRNGNRFFLAIPPLTATIAQFSVYLWHANNMCVCVVKLNFVIFVIFSKRILLVFRKSEAGQVYNLKYHNIVNHLKHMKL